MGEYHFGVGTGRLTGRQIAARRKAARKHGAKFHVVHGNQGHCVCGHGCRLDECGILNYWFSSPNMGEPSDSATARAVAAELARPRRGAGGGTT